MPYLCGWFAVVEAAVLLVKALVPQVLFFRCLCFCSCFIVFFSFFLLSGRRWLGLQIRTKRWETVNYSCSCFLSFCLFDVWATFGWDSISRRFVGDVVGVSLDR
jgi:hypothetical protein